MIKNRFDWFSTYRLTILKELQNTLKDLLEDVYNTNYKSFFKCFEIAILSRVSSKNMIDFLNWSLNLDKIKKDINLELKSYKFIKK